MNRYEILIGKEPPPDLEPDPPEPPKQVREILIGKRGVGKTATLIESVYRVVQENCNTESQLKPVVCVTHKEEYMHRMLGDLRYYVHLVTSERLRDGCTLRGIDIKHLYCDDFDLVKLRHDRYNDVLHTCTG